MADEATPPTRSTSSTPAKAIAAVCGKCETQARASHKPDACFACGVIDGPWVLVVQRSAVRGASLRIDMRFRLAGTWTAAARAQAEADLGDRLEGA